MQTNVAVGLTSLKHQIQAFGAERRKLVPRMHQKSPFGDPNSKKFSGEVARQLREQPGAGHRAQGWAAAPCHPAGAAHELYWRSVPDAALAADACGHVRINITRRRPVAESLRCCNDILGCSKHRKRTFPQRSGYPRSLCLPSSLPESTNCKKSYVLTGAPKALNGLA